MAERIQWKSAFIFRVNMMLRFSGKRKDLFIKRRTYVKREMSTQIKNPLIFLIPQIISFWEYVMHMHQYKIQPIFNSNKSPGHLIDKRVLENNYGKY